MSLRLVDRLLGTRVFSSFPKPVKASFRGLSKPAGWEFTRQEDEFVVGTYLCEASRVVGRHGLRGDVAERLFALYSRAARERRDVNENEAVRAARRPA